MMQTYAEYDSYQEYSINLADLLLPDHWPVEKCRFAFNFSKGLTITKENLQETGIPCVNYGEIHSKFGFEVDPLKHDLKCVDPSYLKSGKGSLLAKGDFVFADTSEDIEGSGNFTHLNSTEPTFAGYHTLIARAKGDANTRFLAYVLDSASFRKQVRKSVKGVKVFSITQAILKNTSVWLPPLPEQTAIAGFLDDKTAKIDELVGIKRRQIALLGERKQILIQNAVTKGLNPNAPMKDSGVDWIGNIPAHWEVKRLKFLCSIGTGERNTEDKVEGGKYPFFVRSQTAERINSYSYDGEAILTAGDGAGVGKVYHYIDGKFDFHQRVYKFSDFSKLGGKYLFHYISRTFYSVAMLGTAKSTVDSLRLPLIQNFWVPFPPDHLEQEAIVDFIDEQSNKINAAITIKENQITKLNEYKTTLINAAVTGKIKVA